jgi:hypothetical protein
MRNLGTDEMMKLKCVSREIIFSDVGRICLSQDRGQCQTPVDVHEHRKDF